jgi:hypothetical protein
MISSFVTTTVTQIDKSSVPKRYELQFESFHVMHVVIQPEGAIVNLLTSQLFVKSSHHLFFRLLSPSISVCFRAIDYVLVATAAITTTTAELQCLLSR